MECAVVFPLFNEERRFDLLSKQVRNISTLHGIQTICVNDGSTDETGRCIADLAGAKLFRVNDALREAIAVPFQSRWVFDVELIARYVRIFIGKGWTR